MKVLVEVTKKDKELMQLIWDGNPRKQMMHVLGISRTAVDCHIRALLRKFGVEDKFALVRFAVRNRLVK